MHLISIKSENDECKNQTNLNIFSYAASNGEWVMPKHILLPMTVRHLTGNAELVTMLNRFGHTQYYTWTMKLETAMCNAVTASESALPPNISPYNNSMLHLCWDNFDLNEETASGYDQHILLMASLSKRLLIVPKLYLQKASFQSLEKGQLSQSQLISNHVMPNLNLNHSLK